MPLFRRRKELETIALKEKEGQSFWTDSFSQAVKNKLLIAFLESTRDNAAFQCKARELLLKDLGCFYLVDPQIQPDIDFQRYFVTAQDVDFPGVIEACQRAISDPVSLRENWMHLPLDGFFQTEVNRILTEHRIAYQLVDLELVEYKSQVLFTNILEPILIQTSNIDELVGVNKAFTAALEELSVGKSANAITDASRALEEALRYLGATGSGPGELFQDARKREILKPHDQPLFDVIFKAVGWVSAQRSNEGDAHQHTEPSSSEAWATVYICGVLILKFLQL